MSHLLPGTRIIELGGDPAGAFGARLFAALGADVIVVEPPGGSPARHFHRIRSADPDSSMLFAYLGAGKRSVVLDPAAEADRAALNALLASADVVIESAAPGDWLGRGVDLEDLRRKNPAMVVCSVTPFGQDGPRAGWRATALTAFAAGGQMALCGEPDLPPLKTAGFQASYQAGLHAFSASMAALFAARRTGRGDHIDLSMQEVQAASLEGFGPAAMVRESDSERAGNQARAVWGIYPCADGHVGVAAMARQSPAVYECIGHPELVGDPAFENLLVNPDSNEIVALFVAEWTSTRTAQQIWAESEGYRAPFALIPTPSDLLAWEPLLASGFWWEVEHPVLGRHVLPALPFALDGDRGAASRAPLLGEHTAEVLSGLPLGAKSVPRAAAGRGPLFEGLKVLDLTQVWAGPYAARFLADMGAEVVHIEGPQFPDAVRASGRPVPRPFDTSAYFNEYNRNKRGLALDLQHAAGVATLKRMVACADVVIENWSVGVAEDLGLGYDDLRAINPRIVLCQMPAFAREGPEATRVGFGPSIEQMGGIVAVQGYEGGPPHKSGISYGDPVGGIAAAGAIALALLRRDETGEGSQVVVYQRDNVVGLVGEYLVAESAGHPLAVRQGNRDPHFAPHDVYRARDDEGRQQVDLQGRVAREYRETWVAIAVDSDAAWAALIREVGERRLEEPRFATLDGRRAAAAEIDAVLDGWVRAQDAASCAARLQAVGVSAAPVLTPLMLVRDRHLQARGFYPVVDHPAVGPHRTTRPVWRLADRRLGAVRPAPTFGQHNDEVLREWAGLSSNEVETLAAAGVIADTPTEGRR